MRKPILFAPIVLFCVISPCSGHEYTSLPLLVNVHAFPDDQQAYDDLKERVEMNVRDANRILNKAAKNLGQDTRLRLGPVKIERNTEGAQSVQQGSQGAKDLNSKGLTELKEKQKNKGLKIYVVTSVTSSGGAEIPGLSAQGTAKKAGRVSWFPQDTFSIAMGINGLEGNAGQFLLHEIGHNAGLSPNHDPANNGVHVMKRALGYTPDDRTINAAQWTELKKLFKKYASTKPNEEQQASFIAPPTETHYALAVDPPVALVRPLDWLMVAKDDDGIFTAEIAWKDAWPSAQPINYYIALGLDTDNNTSTGSFPTYGVGIDTVVDVWAEYAPGGSPIIGGALNYYDPGYQYVYLDWVEYHDLGFTGVDGDFLHDRNAIQLGHDVSVLGAFSSEVPITVFIEEDFLPMNFSTTLAEHPRPDLTSFPVTLANAGPVTVDGEGFEPFSSVDLFIDHNTSVSIVPAHVVIADASGRFSQVVGAAGTRGGDYVVAALADGTGLATGIVTLIGEIFADGFETGDTSLW